MSPAHRHSPRCAVAHARSASSPWWRKLSAARRHGSAIRASRRQRTARRSISSEYGLKAEHAPALSALGNLRNAFAHRLDAKLSDDRINSLYAALSPSDKDVYSCHHPPAGALEKETKASSGAKSVHVIVL